MNGYTEQGILNQRYLAEQARAEAERARIEAEKARRSAYYAMGLELEETGMKIRLTVGECGSAFQLYFRAACKAVELLADEKRKL